MKKTKKFYKLYKRQFKNFSRYCRRDRRSVLLMALIILISFLAMGAANVRAAARFGIKFLSQDFKKQDGFKKSSALSRELGLYRQNYCGCEFSRFRNL